MIHISLHPKQHETMVHGMKLARDFCESNGMHTMAQEFQELIHEIDIIDDVEIKNDDKS